MREIEEKIAAWRVEMEKALAADRLTTVEELEDHLRERIVRLREKNLPVDDAFAQAAAQLGNPRAIADEFCHIRPAKRHIPMKTLRIVVTMVLGAYLLAMGLQLVGVSLAIIEDLTGIAPDPANAKAAFFPNLLVCSLCASGIWAVWRFRRERRADLPNPSANKME